MALEFACLYCAQGDIKLIMCDFDLGEPIIPSLTDNNMVLQAAATRVKSPLCWGY